MNVMLQNLVSVDSNHPSSKGNSVTEKEIKKINADYVESLSLLPTDARD